MWSAPRANVAHPIFGLKLSAPSKLKYVVPQCIICHMRPRSMISTPCGCLAACAPCAERVDAEPNRTRAKTKCLRCQQRRTGWSALPSP